MKSAAIITAAGSGRRMGTDINKVLLPLGEKTVLETAIDAFNNSGIFHKIIITYSTNDKVALERLFKDCDKPISLVKGGKTRQESVFLGLKSLEQYKPDIVLIHDGARPWVSDELVDRVHLKATEKGSAVPVIPSVNAMKKIDMSGTITEHLQREMTVSAQTPQGFQYDKIIEAHRLSIADNFQAIDDTELWDRYFDRVHTVAGDQENIKITYKKDIPWQ